MANVIYPSKAYINAITNALQAVVTFTASHDFTVGEKVSFRVRKPFGMFQINNVIGLVLSKTSDTITVDVDSSDWDVFDYSALNTAGSSPPVCIPVSSGIIPLTDPPQINIVDAFDNRSA
jgi:hypothetical protein